MTACDRDVWTGNTLLIGWRALVQNAARNAGNPRRIGADAGNVKVALTGKTGGTWLCTSGQA